MTDVVVTHAFRTPIGRFRGGLKTLSAVDLGAWVVRETLARADLDPAQVGELCFGHGRQAGCGPNPARQVSIAAGIPDTVPAWTLNHACASGLRAITWARDWIRLGRAEIVVAGGMESMSNTPFLLPRMREGYRLGHAEVEDGMYRDGFACPLAGHAMGRTAETLAERYDLGREEQDRYAAETQARAARALEAGTFRDEIVPVEVSGRKGTTVIEADEHPRPGTTLESLAKLPAVFKRDGTVHAGNSSGITDGAAALLLMSAERATALGLEPLAVAGEDEVAALDPKVMGLGPVPATKALLRRTGHGLEDYEVIELNEAFAAQVLAVGRELPLPWDRVNVNGGAIALGHPIGATGARIVVTLLHEMRRRSAKLGLATLCVSGGQGMSMEFSSPD
jgi:acetyl-CoA C-acetyltransferase